MNRLFAFLVTGVLFTYYNADNGEKLAPDFSGTKIP
jgi:hypothetical protein